MSDARGAGAMTDIGPPFALAGRRVWVAGHRGMVGSALLRRLESEDCEILTVDRGRLDLRRQDDVAAWVQAERPEVVFLAAATVGGIMANANRPADFIYDNVAIEMNVIHAAHLAGVTKLLFLGSSCIYPRTASQPIQEEALLTGALEPTNQWYAVAKICGIMLCDAFRKQHGCDFISVMPTNLYGPGDNFNLANAHVVPALLRKMHEAVQTAAPHVDVWGSGAPRREFLHVDDLADALVFLMKNYSGEAAINVGTGEDVAIRDLAELIRQVTGYAGSFRFDTTKPDGTPRKCLDVSRLSELGWRSGIPLRDGLAQTYDWFRRNRYRT